MDNFIILLLICKFSFTNVFGEDLLQDGRFAGTPANPGEYPYAVYFQYDNETLPACSGSIIGSKYILTQAFCVQRTESYGKFEVLVGCVEWNSSYCQPFQVQEAILHPKYNATNEHLHNIAVLVLTQEIPLSMFAQVVPISSLHVEPNSSLIGVGMDRTGQVVEWLSITSLPNSDCSLLWPAIDETELCTIPGFFVTLGFYEAPVTLNGHQVGIGNQGQSTSDLILRIEPYMGFIFGIIQAYGRTE